MTKTRDTTAKVQTYLPRKAPEPTPAQSLVESFEYARNQRLMREQSPCGTTATASSRRDASASVVLNAGQSCTLWQQGEIDTVRALPAGLFVGAIQLSRPCVFSSLEF